ncbi:MAG TPA: xylulokinase [Clostridiales bacterium]|nr:xylulokinase [Clostridiales bacterium]
MAYLLGIDIGTSGTKTVLFDTSGRPVCDALAEYPLYQPYPGWAEQNPDDWWNATVETVHSVLERSGVLPSEVASIGLSGQMHGLVLLDKNGKVLRPAILWCDQRTAPQAQTLTDRFTRERLIAITGNPAVTGFTASKILWVQENEPEVFAKCAQILLPKDYIRYKLTGIFATEVSDASGTQLLDVPARKWSPTMLEGLSIDASLLPPVFESPEISGKVSLPAAALTGLLQGTPVAGGAGDQAAGAVGNGIVEQGVVSVTIGSSGVVFAHTDQLTIDPMGRLHTLCHAVPGCWHVMGVTQAAGLSLKWFKDEFCAAEIEAAAQLSVDPYVLLDQQAALSPLGCNGLFFLPYLMGERTPHLDPAARGVFFGLSAIHKRRDLLRAIMEGVSFSLCDCLELIEALGLSAGKIRLSGGGSKSVFWRQMLADVFGRSVSAPFQAGGPALGAALLAGVGVGLYPSVPAACNAVSFDNEPALAPILENTPLYRTAHKRYQRLYVALKQEF